jgi:hypothetical protein
MRSILAGLLFVGGFACGDAEPTLGIDAGNEPEDAGSSSIDASAVDADGDGVTAPTDCNDADPLIYPGATDPCEDDGVDNDCDEEIDEGGR